MNKNFLGKILSHNVILLVLIICGCGKQEEDKNRKLAQTYYKLCMSELSQNLDKNTSPQESYRRALEYIQESINCCPSAENLAIKATLLFRLGDFKQSCAFFESALKQQAPEKIKASILNNYACLLAQMGDTDKALNIFKQLERDSNYFTPQAAVFNRGKIFFDKQDYAQAAQEFSKAVKLAPEYTDAHYFLGLTAVKLNDPDLAKKEMEYVLFLEPNHEGALKLVDTLEKNISL